MRLKDQLKAFVSCPAGQMMVALGVISVLILIALPHLN